MNILKEFAKIFIKSKLDDESLTREDLSNIVSNSTISAYKDEMDAISDLNEARQGAIDKIDEEIQKNAELIKSGLYVLDETNVDIILLDDIKEMIKPADNTNLKGINNTTVIKNK